MHEPTIQQSQGGRRRQLPPALHLTRSRVELLLFSGAIAVLALHAAVDSFIAPEPGTGPGDHLLRGGVTLAIAQRGGLSLPTSSRRGTGGDRGGARRARARGRRARGLRCPRGRCPRRRLDRLPALPGRARPYCSRGRPALALAQAGAAPLAAPGRAWVRHGCLGVLVRRSGRDGDSLHAPPPRCCRAGQPGTTLRAGDAADERRPPARRLVCPLAQRRGRDLLPDAQGEAAAGADARPPRLRRAPARRARLRRQPGRPEPVRLGRRQRHRRRRRLAATAARRPRRPDRRDRLLGRRRDDAANRRRQHRAARRRLRRRRVPLSPRRAAVRTARLVHVAARAGGAERGAHA